MTAEEKAIADHVLTVTMGEYTTYRLTCNLGADAPCHLTCHTHPEGGCGEPDDDRECVQVVYEGGCIIAEWVNDGGIECVGFEHTIELPMRYQWDAGHDAPMLFAVPDDEVATPTSTPAALREHETDHGPRARHIEVVGGQL
jgi:hypothetical protein